MKFDLRRIRISFLLISAAFFIKAQNVLAQFPTAVQLTSSVFTSENAALDALSDLTALKNDTIKITHINELAKYFIIRSRTYDHNDNHRRAIDLLKEGVRLSEQLHKSSSPGKYESAMLLAHAYLISGNFTTGEDLYQQIINTYHDSGNKEGEAHAWFRFAYTLTGLNDEAEQSKVASAYNNSISLYREMGNTEMEIVIGIQKAAAVFNSDDKHNEAESILKSLAEKSLSNGCIHLGEIYVFFAEIKRYRGNHNDALFYALAALKELRESNDTLEIADYYGEIAMEYEDLSMPEESITYYQKCLEVREKLNVDQYTIYRTAVMMTSEMIKLNQAAKGFTILNSLNERNPPRGGLEKAIIDHGIANCLAASGNFKLAEKYYLSMIKGYKEYGRNGEVRLIAYLDGLNFFITHKQFREAEPYHDQMDEMATFASMSKKMEVQRLLFKIDSARSKFLEAMEHYQLFKQYNDSIFNKGKNEQIEMLHIRYSSEQKDQNIVLLKKQTELQQATLVQSETIKNSLFTGTIMLILLLSLLYNRYRLKTKNNLLLEKQREEISRKNFTQQLLLNEKDWLVREIHHRVKNNFHMVVGLMGTQSAYIKNSEALYALEESKHRIHTMSLIHQKLYQSENMSATVMSDYIHELTSYLKDSFQTSHILFTIDCEPIELELSYSLPLGLILNEAITNSIKYAFSENHQAYITVYLAYTSRENIRLIIRDNGIGMPLQNSGEMKPSMGLNLMKGLTEDIGGTFSIKNDNGTMIQIDFHCEGAISGRTKSQSPIITRQIYQES